MQVSETFFTRKQAELGVALNKIQKEAVLHTAGPLLLLASPGSGKTTTIIMKIGYLIEVVGIDPTKIKAVTFSKASANDMIERYKRFFPNLPPVEFSTIHSLAFQIVRDYLYFHKVDYQLIEGKNERALNKKILLRNIFKAVNDKSITDDQLEELTTFISLIKNKMIPERKWSTVKCDVPKATQVLKEYEKYKNAGTNKLLLDYDDMLTIANGALEKDPNLLRKYQRNYDYILTDESQDTSLVQHKIIEKLVQTHLNLCVVADDDQSIYRWRAAEPQYLLNFKKVYPKATILKMEQNYRSSKDIVDVANQFIKQNKHRYDKNMFTENQAATPIRTKTLNDYKEQANYIVEQINQEENLREIAILYRNNSSSILLMDALDQANIPFYMKDSNNRFFSHWIVEDILNFMRLSYDMSRVDIFERIYFKFHLFLKKTQIQQLKQENITTSVFDHLLQSTHLQDWQKKKIQKINKFYEIMQKKTPFQIIMTIREDFGYEQVLHKMSEKLGFKMEYLLEVLNTIEEISKSTKTMVHFANRIKELETLLRTSKFNKNENAITLSTLHSSKGLEFEKVYIIDLINGVIPTETEIEDAKEGNSEEMEEAVRLFYVGMTRAKDYLELITYEKRFGKSVSRSKFVNDVERILRPPTVIQQKRKVLKTDEKIKYEMKPNVPDNPRAIKEKAALKVGLLIKHRVFGRGEIVNCTEEVLEIQFEKYSKSLSIETCLQYGLLEAVE